MVEEKRNHGAASAGLLPSKQIKESRRREGEIFVSWISASLVKDKKVRLNFCRGKAVGRWWGHLAWVFERDERGFARKSDE